MTRKFNIGDRVRVNYPPSPLHGVETTVISGLQPCSEDDSTLMYDVDVPHPEPRLQWFGFEPHELIPIDDGRQLATWEDVQKVCGWKPEGVDA